jgi:hypothetical protein
MSICLYINQLINQCERGANPREEKLEGVQFDIFVLFN